MSLHEPRCLVCGAPLDKGAPFENDVRKSEVCSDKCHETYMGKEEGQEGEFCEVCGKFVEGFEYQGCCSGFECGCMGQPIEPCICSNECWDKLMSNKKS